MNLGFGAVLAFALMGEAPPTELRLFAKGDNPSSFKGAVQFTTASAKSVMAFAKRWGNRYCFDLDHLMLEKNPNDAKAAKTALGWYDLEVRNGELWAVNISWTPDGFEAVKRKDLGYFSPAFNFDEKTKEVTRLINCALTCLPALDNIPSLVSLSAMSGAVPFEAYPVVEGPWDGAAAVMELRKHASSDGSGDPETIDWSEYAKGFADVTGEGDKLGDFHLPHHRVVDGKLVTSKAGVIAAGNVVQGARGGVNIPAEDLPSVKKHLAGHYREFKMKAPWETEDSKGKRSMADEKSKKDKISHIVKAHKAMMGDAHDPKMAEKLDEMEESAVDKAYSKACSFMPDGDGDSVQPGKDDDVGTPEKVSQKRSLETFAASIMQLTGAKSIEAAQGAVMGLSQGQTALSERLAKLEAAQSTDRRSALLARGRTEGKITPAQADSELFRKTMSVDVLEGFLSTAPKVVETTPQKQGDGSGAVGTRNVAVDGKTVTLSQQDVEFCTAIGLTTPEELAGFARNKLSIGETIGSFTAGQP